MQTQTRSDVNRLPGVDLHFLPSRNGAMGNGTSGQSRGRGAVNDVFDYDTATPPPSSSLQAVGAKNK